VGGGAFHSLSKRLSARFAQRSACSNRYAKSSVGLFEFPQQLLFQMSPRGLFDRAPLCDYAFLLRVTFPSCSWFHRLRHVPDFRPLPADLSLLWFCVWIHKNLALQLVIKITGFAACRAVIYSTEDS